MDSLAFLTSYEGLLFGQDLFLDRLMTLASSNKLPPTLLFNGPKGIGKLKLALTFAHHLIAEQFKQPYSFYPTQPVLERLQLLLDTVEGKPITKDYLNQIQPFLTLKSEVYRVVIIPHIEQLNHFVLNALLKTLEEPNHKVVFILTCNNKHKALTPIVSRSVVMNVPLVDSVAFKKIAIATCPIDFTDSDLALCYSIPLRIKELPLIKQARVALTAFYGQPNMAKLQTLQQLLVQHKYAYIEWLYCMNDWIKTTTHSVPKTNALLKDYQFIQQQHQAYQVNHLDLETIHTLIINYYAQQLTR